MIRWEPTKSRYLSGKDGYSGKIQIFQVYYDGATSRGQKEKYEISCYLPSIKRRIGHFMTEEEAINKAEAVFNMWLDMTELSQK